MIDKYEGHTIEGSHYNHKRMNDADIELIADAPLLLAEVKECAAVNAQHDDILEKQEWEYILGLIE